MLTFSTSALSTGTGIQWGGGGVGVTDRSVGQFAGMTVVVDSQLTQLHPGSSGHRQEFRCYLTKSGTILEGQQSDLVLKQKETSYLSKMLCLLIIIVLITLWVLSGMMLLITQLTQT